LTEEGISPDVSEIRQIAMAVGRIGNYSVMFPHLMRQLRQPQSCLAATLDAIPYSEFLGSFCF
jgi:hypothetical protein